MVHSNTHSAQETRTKLPFKNSNLTTIFHIEECLVPSWKIPVRQRTEKIS